MASHDSFSKPAVVCYKFDNQIPTHTGTQTIKDTTKGSKPRGRPPMFVKKKGNEQTFLTQYIVGFLLIISYLCLLQLLVWFTGSSCITFYVHKITLAYKNKRIRKTKFCVNFN